jgi:hypothetical protein
MAVKPKRPGRSYAAQRELIELAKKLDLAGIVKKNRQQAGSNPQAGPAARPVDHGAEMKCAQARPTPTLRDREFGRGRAGRPDIHRADQWANAVRAQSDGAEILGRAQARDRAE